MFELSELKNKESIKIHEKNYGSFNDPPPNFIEIKEEEFSKSKFFSETIMHIEYRQITRFKTDDVDLKNVLSSGVKLFYFYDGTGIAIGSNYQKKKVYFFKFAKCFHKYEEMSQEWCRKNKVEHLGRCYHVYKCKNCGFLESADSSD
jgi:hypothetical protein